MSVTESSLEYPRGLIFSGSLWLVATWLLTLGVQPPVQATSASYTPGVRIMILSIAAGLMIAWPLLRLSQRKQSYSVVRTIFDMIVLISLIQMVIWPLRLLTPWNPLRTAAIDMVLVSLIVLVGAILAAATTSERNGPRVLAMAACLALGFLGPFLGAFSAVYGSTASLFLEFNPYVLISNLATGGGSLPSKHEWRMITCIAVAAALAWFVLTPILMISKDRAQKSHTNSN